jgi:hypothetical protein
MKMKIKETLKEKKELIKKGSVFPVLNYLATGYLIGFFVSTFFGAFLTTTELTGASSFAYSVWSAEKVVAFAVIGLVLAGAIVDFVGKKISKKQGIITVIVSVLFGVLVQLSYLVFQGIM